MLPVETLIYSCKHCHNNLVHKKGHSGYYYLCSQYPKCHFAYPITNNAPNYQRAYFLPLLR